MNYSILILILILISIIIYFSIDKYNQLKSLKNCKGIWETVKDSCNTETGTITQKFKVLKDAEPGGIECIYKDGSQREYTSNDCKKKINCVSKWEDIKDTCDPLTGYIKQRYNISVIGDNGGTLCETTHGNMRDYTSPGCNKAINCEGVWEDVKDSCDPLTGLIKQKYRITIPPLYGGLGCEFKQDSEKVASSDYCYKTIFEFTGSEQKFVVPKNVKKIKIEAYGAEGGKNNNINANFNAVPGKGGKIVGTLDVTPGQVFYIYVGGKGGNNKNCGGWNGGGKILSSYKGMNTSGGGSTDIRNGDNTINNRIIVAGGGGGIGYEELVPFNQFLNNGGDGGPNTGGSCNNTLCGKEGEQTIGGIGGYISNPAGNQTNMFEPGLNGELGVGGDSAPNKSGTNQINGGGGGGGGYYGGGGGTMGGGGGGGSSYANSSITVIENTKGVNSGNGKVLITLL